MLGVEGNFRYYIDEDDRIFYGNQYIGRHWVRKSYHEEAREYLFSSDGIYWYFLSDNESRLIGERENWEECSIWEVYDNLGEKAYLFDDLGFYINFRGKIDYYDLAMKGLKENKVIEEVLK